jgi:histidinol dehydrogenase
MPVRLERTAPGFEAAFAAFLNTRREQVLDIRETVAAILADVERRGDAAVAEYTARFDRFTPPPEGLRIGADAVDAAIAKVAPETMAALELAAERIRRFHENQPVTSGTYPDPAGATLTDRWTPIDAVGVYVPGGLAAYPSSVLMSVIPAAVAGVPRLVMTVPTPDDHLNPLVMAAARLAGIDEIHRIGGAQAVGALAFGTETIAPVDKIVGPGNAYVAEAKRQVFGQVGIDMIAGPSEVLVVADADNDPAWIAADLLSQAEHDENAQAILITDDGEFAERVESAIAGHLAGLATAERARTSWERNGAVIRVPDVAEAAALVDRVAPEHLELAVAAPEALAAKVRHAGAIFLGRYTPEAIGDYVAGPNHVLPTNRSARFSSGLNVLDFMKRTTLVKCDADSLALLAPAAIRLATIEGLPAHALSLAIRLNRLGTDETETMGP